MADVQSGYSVPVGGSEGRGDPFRGVRPFGHQDADLFFGRRRELDALLAVLDRSDLPLVALFGKHGVGKTSLLRAGLAPRLERTGFLPVYVDGQQEPSAALKQAVFQLSAKPPHGDEDAVAYAVRITQRFPEGMVVMFDDLTDRLDGDGLEPLVQTVGALLERAERPIRCLFCIDSGAFHRLADLEAQLGQAISPDARYRLESLGTQEAETAIEEGVLASGLYFEQGLSQTMAQDLTRHGPVLPLDLQLAVTRSIERKCLTVKRYVRAGGGAVFQAEWLRARLREAGPRRGLRVLSQLADRRAGAPGWIAPAALAQATGVSDERVAFILDVFARHAMLARHEDDDGVKVRLLPAALVPLVRELDGRMRARRVRARLVLRKRLVAGGLLRPRELLRARRLSNPKAQERALLRRSTLVWGGLTGVVVAAIVALLAWVHVAAGRGYHLGRSGGPDADGGTVVLRRGNPGLGRFAVLPHRPALGSIQLDTGIPVSHLGEASRRGLSAVRGRRAVRKGRWPTWFSQVLGRLAPHHGGVMRLLLGQPDEAWAALTRAAAASAGHRLAVLELIARVGTGQGAEAALLAAALKDPVAGVRRRAVRALLRVAARHPQRYVKQIDAAARDRDPGVRWLVLQWASRFGARRTLRLATLAMDPAVPALRARALSLAIRLGHQAPAEAAAVLAACLGPRALPHEAAQARLALGRLLRHKPGIAVKGLAARLQKSGDPEEQGALLALLATASDKHLIADLGPRLLHLAGGTYEDTARAALALAVRVADPKALEAKLRGWAAHRKSAALRARAARGYGALLRKGHKVDLAPLRTLVGDPVVAVRVATVRAFGAAPMTEYLTVMRLGMDRSAAVRAALIETMAEMGNPDPYKILRPLQAMSQGGGSRLKAALTSAVGRLVKTKKYWGMAKSYVVQATRDTKASVRKAGVEALGRIGHLQQAATLSALRARLADSDLGVRKAVVEAAGRIARRAPVEAGILLIALLADPSPLVVLRAVILVTRHSGHPKLQGPLSAALPAALTSPSEPVRAAALALLARLPLKVASKGLDGALARAYRLSTSAAVRKMVLAEAARRRASAALTAAASSASGPERITALRMILGAPTPAHAPTVAAALSDADPAVQRAAVAAAAQLLPKASARLLPALYRITDDPDHALRGAALAALGRATTDLAAVRRRLAAAARRPEVASRAAAATAYGGLDGGATQIAALLRDPAQEVRLAAVQALARQWAAARTAARLAKEVTGRPRDRQRRLAAALALHRQLGAGPERAAGARRQLQALQRGGDPLASTLAGAAFAVSSTGEGRADLVWLLSTCFRW